MYTLSAALTAVALAVGYLPGVSQETAPVAAATSAVEFLDQGAYTDDDGHEISYAVWREDGRLQADVSVFDLAAGDTLEMWIEGGFLRFEGTYAGEPFGGSEPAAAILGLTTAHRSASVGSRWCASAPWRFWHRGARTSRAASPSRRATRPAAPEAIQVGKVAKVKAAVRAKAVKVAVATAKTDPRE